MNFNVFDFLILLKRGSKKKIYEYLIIVCKKKNLDLIYVGIVCKEIKLRVNNFGRKRE